jgi:hypothetical protein
MLRIESLSSYSTSCLRRAKPEPRYSHVLLVPHERHFCCFHDMAMPPKLTELSLLAIKGLAWDVYHLRRRQHSFHRLHVNSSFITSYMMNPSREYDIVLLGSTRYTGSICAEYITKTFPTTLEWPIAGRSAESLEKISQQLRHVNPDPVIPSQLNTITSN